MRERAGVRGIDHPHLNPPPSRGRKLDGSIPPQKREEMRKS